MAKYKKAVEHAVKAVGHLTDAIGDITKRIYPLCESYKCKGEPVVLVEVLQSDLNLLTQMAYASWVVRRSINRWKDAWFAGAADELHLLLDDVGFNRILEEVEYGSNHVKKEATK